MRIAQIGSIWETTPPTKYGGTELVVSNITEGLVAKGHDVTLFATADSKTKASLSSVVPTSLFRQNIPWTNIMYPLLHITNAFEREKEFDIIHMHLNKASDYVALPLAQTIPTKVVFTLHFPYPKSQLRHDREAVLQKYKQLQYISISNAQRKGGENMNWKGTVYNGIDTRLYKPNITPGNHFVWYGKFNPDKGTKEAILAAKKAGVSLVLAGKVDLLEKEDKEYFETEIKPLIDGKQITYVGEIDMKGKHRYVATAKAFLNPISWNEPFGLVMTESMALGTPVISFKKGAASEIIQNGENGFLVKNIDEMVKMMEKIDQIDRLATRQSIEEKFTKEKMVEEYEQIYREIISISVR